VRIARQAVSGPAIALDRQCYANGSDVSLVAAGFTPGAPPRITFDGQQLQGGPTAFDASGSLKGEFTPGMVNSDRPYSTHTVVVSDGTISATARFPITIPSAAIMPNVAVKPYEGSPFPALRQPPVTSTRAYAFRLYGFGLQTPNVPVYVHYVDPRGRLRGTQLLGAVGGPCGTLATSKLHMRPFGRPPTRGLWHLQFDTTRQYTRRSVTVLGSHVGSRAAKVYYYVTPPVQEALICIYKPTATLMQRRCGVPA
jgi:hypothetical protein